MLILYETFIWQSLVLINLIFTYILKNLCQITIGLQNNELQNNVHFILTDIIH
jgi:hypothetical protein